jgi:hypothetical protein
MTLPKKVIKETNSNSEVIFVTKVQRCGLAIEFFIAGDGELLGACRERIAREDFKMAK